MAGLLVAKQIAGPADIHVVGGKSEPRTKRVQRLHHLEPAARLRRQHPVRIGCQIGIGALPAAPYTATKLVELRQAEHVGPVDNHRVGRRDIDAGLDDVGGQQDVRLAIGKTGHDIVKLGRRHAAMGRQDARIRHQHRQPVIDALQIVDARADAEDLAATEHLALYGLAQDHAVPRADKGAHRQPVDRRRGNQRHLAHARQRHLQRARDRRRRQRQNMDIATQLLQPFLLRDAEMLFLIDNQQAEIVEFNGFCQ